VDVLVEGLEAEDLRRLQQRALLRTRSQRVNGRRLRTQKVDLQGETGLLIYWEEER
jgi:hypothetical protein